MRLAMINELSKKFKALSDPNRLRILLMLKIKKLCVCEITSILELASSTVSQHLSILKSEGFIIEEKDGKWVNYYINPSPHNPAVASVVSQLNFWVAGDNEVIQDKYKLNLVDRTLCTTKS